MPFLKRSYQIFQELKYLSIKYIIICLVCANCYTLAEWKSPIGLDIYKKAQEEIKNKMHKNVFFILLIIASCNALNAQFTKLLDFSGALNGKRPYGNLVSDGIFLYGMTQIGGTGDYGTILKISPDGSGYSKLFDFNHANGSTPCGSLFYDGIFLYGTTSNGGANNDGTLFRIKPDGSGDSIIHNFDSPKGHNPFYGSLISDGTYLYGTTLYGGQDDQGVVYKVKLDGTAYTLLYEFQQTPNAIGGVSTK